MLSKVSMNLINSLYNKEYDISEHSPFTDFLDNYQCCYPRDTFQMYREANELGIRKIANEQYPWKPTNEYIEHTDDSKVKHRLRKWVIDYFGDNSEISSQCVYMSEGIELPKYPFFMSWNSILLGNVTVNKNVILKYVTVICLEKDERIYLTECYFYNLRCLGCGLYQNSVISNNTIVKREYQLELINSIILSSKILTQKHRKNKYACKIIDSCINKLKLEGPIDLYSCFFKKVILFSNLDHRNKEYVLYQGLSKFDENEESEDYEMYYHNCYFLDTDIE